MKKINLDISCYTEYIEPFSKEICQIDKNSTENELVNKAKNYFVANPIMETDYGHEARVWVLIGSNEDEETTIMVAQAEDISKEVIPHIRSMFMPKNDRTKKSDIFYGNAKDKYDKLVFYEIIIDTYLEEENSSEMYKEMYELYKDYYCEALLAIELKVEAWKPYGSGISKRIYYSLLKSLKPQEK